MFALTYFRNNNPVSELYSDIDKAIDAMVALVSSAETSRELLKNIFFSSPYPLTIHTENNGAIKLTSL